MCVVPKNVLRAAVCRSDTVAFGSTSMTAVSPVACSLQVMSIGRERGAVV